MTSFFTQKDRNQPPLVDISPNSVPSPIFVRYLNETIGDHSLYQDIDLDADLNLKHIQILERFSASLDESIHRLYSHRSIMRPIKKHIKTTPENSEMLANLALAEATPILQLTSDTISTSTDAIAEVCSILKTDSIWSDGIYSSSLMLSICKLISRLLTLDLLHIVKQSFLFDILTLNDYILGNDMKSGGFLDVSLTKWLQAASFSEDAIITDLKSAPVTSEQAIAIIYRWIQHALSSCIVISPDLHTALLQTLVFFVKNYPNAITTESLPFLAQIIRTHPYLPLIHEFSFNVVMPLLRFQPLALYINQNPSAFRPIFADYDEFREEFTQTSQALHALASNLASSISNSSPAHFPSRKSNALIASNASSNASNASSNASNASSNASHNSSHNTSHNASHNTSHNTSHNSSHNSSHNAGRSFSISPNYNASARLNDGAKELLDTSARVPAVLARALDLIGRTIYLLRVAYADKLVSPPDSPPEMKAYERSVRSGYKAEELKAMLQLLAAARELHDLIRSHLDVLSAALGLTINQAFQEFVKDGLVDAYLAAKHNKATFRAAIMKLRALAGKYEKGDTTDINLKKGTKKSTITPSVGSPSPQLIELVRIQMEIMTNPESHYRRSANSLLGLPPLTEAEERFIRDFLEASNTWCELLTLEQTLAAVSDQSAFYFKEVQLDLNDAVQFPARSSLPFVLCQFALDNYVQPELTEIIFYPLSIYDDAAFSAINEHHSAMIFDEIKAEARVCLDTLSVLIGEFTFNAFRTFVTMRQLPEKVTETLMRTHAYHWPSSQAYRLRTLLQQDQYYLLSNQVVVKSLIAPRVDHEVNSAMKLVYQMATEQGIISTLAITRALEILRETHRLLMNQGIPLMPLGDIERVARTDAGLQNSSSKYLSDVSSHLFKLVVRKYTLSINPLRFLPNKKVFLSAETLGKLNLGKIIKDALEPAVAFVTVHHFIAFVRSIPDSAFVSLCKSVRENLQKAFAHFLGIYKTMAPRLTRIKDCPFGTNPHIAFARYEGAYKLLVNDSEFDTLLGGFRALGNSIAIAEMLDEAFILKQCNIAQSMSYLQSVDQNSFDPQFQEEIRFATSRPSELLANSYNMLIKITAAELTRLVRANADVFQETTTDPFNLPSLKGFASCWSVVSFVYTLQECARMGDQPIGFLKYGQGVMMAAAAILEITEQENIAKMTSIATKMRRTVESDAAGVGNNLVQKFVAIGQFTEAMVDWCSLFLRPHIEDAKKKV